MWCAAQLLSFRLPRLEANSSRFRRHAQRFGSGQCPAMPGASTCNTDRPLARSNEPLVSAHNVYYCKIAVVDSLFCSGIGQPGHRRISASTLSMVPHAVESTTFQHHELQQTHRGPPVRHRHDFLSFSPPEG